MSDRVADIRQRAAEEQTERAELDAVIDLEQIDREAVLEQLHAEDDRESDNPVAWRRAS